MGTGWKMESPSASISERWFFSNILQGFCFVQKVSSPYWLGISNFAMPCLCYYCPCPFHGLLIFQQLSGWAPDGFLFSKISNAPKSCSRYPKPLRTICGYGHLLSDPTSTGRNQTSVTELFWFMNIIWLPIWSPLRRCSSLSWWAGVITTGLTAHPYHSSFGVYHGPHLAAASRLPLLSEHPSEGKESLVPIKIPHPCKNSTNCPQS